MMTSLIFRTKRIEKSVWRHAAAHDLLRADSDSDDEAASFTNQDTLSRDTAGHYQEINQNNDNNLEHIQPSGITIIPETEDHSIASKLSRSTTTSKIERLLYESRIVAPNVSKLSPYSAVEVRISSTVDNVAVLCSVDVLKMRSGFFYDILCEQEHQQELAAIKYITRTSSPHLRHNIEDSKNEENLLPIKTPCSEPNIMWRDSIVVPGDNAPYDTAAFLESLHEGKSLYRGEWNFCWAKLRLETKYYYNPLPVIICYY